MSARVMRALVGFVVVLVSRALWAPAAEFSDNFEGYAAGTNPTNVYDFMGFAAWNPPGPFPPTDLYRVGTVGSNKVLRFHRSASSYHFPVVLKVYRQAFTEIQKVGISYLRTQHSMGWTILDVDYLSETNFYRVFLDYQNRLIVLDGRGNRLASPYLWSDTGILAMSHRVEVERVQNQLTVTVIRLDTQARKSVVVHAPSLGGQVRFGFEEDWYGGVHFNADDFYVKGRIPGEAPQGEVRFLLINSPPLEGYRFVGTVRDKIWTGKKPGFLWLDCYVKE